MKLRARLPSSVQTLELSSRPDAEITVADLLAKLPSPVTAIRAGYPPKPVSLDPTATLHSLGIKNGEQLVVAGPAGATPSATPSGSTQGAKPSGPPKSAKPSDNTSEQSVVCGDSYLCLRVMEDDNSCLFRAVGYAFMKSIDSMFELRTIVANAILEDPIEYNDAILGKPAADYVSWIRQPNSWGGAIELSILAKHFNVTICSLDVSTLRVDQFNPGQRQFIIVVYSGIHYDAVALSPLGDGTAPVEFDATLFDVDETGAHVLEALTKLGSKLKKAHYYTDTAQFQLRCSVCRTVVIGETGASKHAESTGHQSFGEV